MEANEKRAIWKNRFYLLKEGKGLKLLLDAVNWGDAVAVLELHEVLYKWLPSNPYDALELLDAKFADEQVRSYAVRCLEQFSDDDLILFMPQLIQALKYEAYHASKLAIFLLKRSIANRIRVGHFFFWFLRAEIIAPEFAERFSLLAEIYLRGCGDHRTELVNQLNLVTKLRDIAITIQKSPIQKRNDILKTKLEALNWRTDLQIPSNPTVSAGGLLLDKCKCKDSFTVRPSFAFPLSLLPLLNTHI